jgi:hypothetical protein
MNNKPLNNTATRNDLNLCPYCRSAEITNSEFQQMKDLAYVWVSCDDCDASWCDVYKFIGWEE